MTHIQYQGCHKSSEHNDGGGDHKWYAVRVNENGECVNDPEEAGRTLVNGEVLGTYGYVAHALCRALINAGKCPANMLGIN